MLDVKDLIIIIYGRYQNTEPKYTIDDLNGSDLIEFAPYTVCIMMGKSLKIQILSKSVF